MPNQTANPVPYLETATAIALTKGGAHPSFESVTIPVRLPDEGEVLIRDLLTSVDPHMGVAMRDLASYGHAYPEGEPVTADSLGVVVASRHPGIEPGAWMLNSSGWREYAMVPGDPAQLADPALGDDVAWMSALGMTGITAWTAVHETGNVRGRRDRRGHRRSRPPSAESRCSSPGTQAPGW